MLADLTAEGDLGGAEPLHGSIPAHKKGQPNKKIFLPSLGIPALDSNAISRDLNRFKSYLRICF